MRLVLLDDVPLEKELLLENDGPLDTLARYTYW